VRAEDLEIDSLLVTSKRSGGVTAWSLAQGRSKALIEVVTLGRTLNKRAVDVLAYLDRPGTSNGPTEAINGRLEHLRGSALGFRNLTNYIARCLLETGGFRPWLHPRM
jgi:transposase